MKNVDLVSLVGSFAVVSPDGSVDVSASTDRFLGALNTHAANVASSGEAVAQAVNAAFDKHPLTKFNLDALATVALAEMSVDPSTIKEVKARVLSFVRANAGDHSDLSKPFAIQKGRRSGDSSHGSVFRWTDSLREAAATKAVAAE